MPTVPGQPTTLSQMGMMGGDLGSVGVPSMQNNTATAPPISSNPGRFFPRILVPMEKDADIGSAWVFCAEFFGAEALPLQIARTAGWQRKKTSARARADRLPYVFVPTGAATPIWLHSFAASRICNNAFLALAQTALRGAE